MGVANLAEMMAAGAMSPIFNNAVAVVGDSIVANGAVSALGMAGGRAWWQWAQIKSGRRFYLCNWSALGGAKSDVVLSTYLPNIIAGTAWANASQGGTTTAPRPGRVVDCSGTNDLFVAPTKTIAELLAVKLQIWALARANGIEPIACTITPRNSVPETIIVAKYNAALIQLAAQNRVRVIDFYSACADLTTGQWKSGYNISGDPIHPEATGARAMGLVAAAVFNDQQTLVPSLTVQNDNVMWSNSLFLNDNGSGFPAGAGWGNGLGAVATSSINTGDSNVIGNRLDITVTGAGSPYIRTPAFVSAAGRYVAVSARFKAVPAGSSPAWRVNLIKAFNDGTPLVGMSAGGASVLDTDGWCDFYSVVQLPTGFGSPVMEFGVSGVGSVLSVAQVGIYDLTANGVTVQ